MIGYNTHVILGFRHSGLRRLFEKNDSRRITPNHRAKIKRILARLDDASHARDMNLPGFELHRLTGDLAGFWAVKVSRNWRVIFRFEGQHVRDVNLIDYH